MKKLIDAIINIPWDTLLEENNRYLDLACGAACLLATGYFGLWIFISYITR